MREGWEIKTLNEVCKELFAGGDVPKDRSSKFSTEEYNIPIFSNGAKNDGLYGYTDIPRVKDPSITVSARGTIGYSSIRIKPYLPVVRLIVLIPDKELITLHFLKYVIESMDFGNSGSSIPQLTVPMIKKYNCSIPPLSEQKQLVAILDKAFTAIDQAKTNIKKNIENAKELFQSKLNEIFSKKGAGWEEKTLNDITTKIGSGATPRGGQASYKESGISLIRSMNVHDDGFREKKLAFIDDEQANKLSNVTIEENDVLLNITGASVARCCVVDSSFLPARVNQHVSIIRLKNGIMNHRFLHYALTSKKTKDLLLGIGEQGATRQAITKVQLENFRITFPLNIEVQNKLVELFDELRNNTEKIESNYTKKLEDLEDLKKSILQKAFAGELTSTGSVTNQKEVAI
jgi:type I restriction enzyme S subunit